ncbi:UDP-glucose 4-epimerase GalE [Peptostreptococcus equinus]|uniref:UDP-glucose 4-epimerase n=1 Tax=Peptostreptococcus equinus TaxID=3003601 RepID=A0ABY7JQF3_9FIRM|nr:UDP-glucose 4-epimerase GalE [Peptostreptococcus sp. CBA3647]WAW15579.1 UDP-glucose 4-epimerase GalE [Peptostreptococcus sp. CBA3647]
MRDTKSILLAGGAGYIGSHICVELLNRDNKYKVIVVDNFSNSNPKVLDRIKDITGKDVKFYEIDTRSNELEKVFKENKIDAVIDLAAYKAVGDSVKNPLKYYNNNLISQMNMLLLMKKYSVNNFVFSSSATVYGEVKADELPINENHPTSTTNPYGSTKLMGEQILQDCSISDPDFNCIVLRYFNPIGAHESGKIGEEAIGIPANVMPYITKVAIGELPYLNIFGNDYDTIDGTGVRDYIHVVDLAKGHVKALERLLNNRIGIEYFNLGAGKGFSVLELIHAFSRAYGKQIEYKIVDRRPGDAAIIYADPSKAKDILNWQVEYSLDDMCRDSWNWQSKNPNGYNI